MTDDVKWLRDMAAHERKHAWLTAAHAIRMDEAGLPSRHNYDAANVLNEQANKHARAADALALVESAGGAAPFGVWSERSMVHAVTGIGIGDAWVLPASVRVGNDEPMLAVEAERKARAALAARLMATALKLGGSRE